MFSIHRACQGDRSSRSSSTFVGAPRI